MDYAILDSGLREITTLEVALDLMKDDLKKQKNGPNYKAICPFHLETKPSFYVKVEWDQFKCFGCGIQGGPFSLAFSYLPPEDALAYFEKKLCFSRHDLGQMAIFKWSAYRQERDFFDCHTNFLESYEPFLLAGSDEEPDFGLVYRIFARDEGSRP